MPRWVPREEWSGQDAYVVGGGDSLSGFDWDLVRGRNVIGCNTAFLNWACKITVFGDRDWWEHVGKLHLEGFGGRVVACTPYVNDLPAWVLWCERLITGLSAVPGVLGFNSNTGSLALNLALQLGAKRVFLLGFDMVRGENGRTNFHEGMRDALGRPVERYQGATAPESYDLFQRGYRLVAEELPKKFPGREIWNVSDVSRLEAFPRTSIAAHFGRARERTK